MNIRLIDSRLRYYLKKYPVITLTGPRQSGKTTLCKMLLPAKDYVSLEDPDERKFAENDPTGFLKRFPKGAILDEVQRVPEIISYIQGIVDNSSRSGMFILTGSAQFEMIEKVTQSLAGRTAILRLLPFSYSEAYSDANPSVDQLLYKGFFPRIHDKRLNPTEANSFYVETYIERDVRSFLNVKDLRTFTTFLRLCAARSGQILNMQSLGNDCGVNHSTIKSWISVLEASYILYLLKPYYKNLGKRLIKSPKMYVLDSGLLCYLVGIHSSDILKTHPLRGSIFETFIVTEFLKSQFNAGKADNLYYFRDNTGNEIDLIAEEEGKIHAVEIKSAETFSEDHLKGLKFFKKLIDKSIYKSSLIYAGKSMGTFQEIEIRNFRDVVKSF